MIPILFAENSTIFTTNGIGRLSDAISCDVLEERNGQYELTMLYPVSGEHSEDIVVRSIIVAKPSQGGNIQPFRVHKISKPINGKYTISAYHISYDLNKNVSMPFSVSASSSACSQALAALKSNAVESCPFSFSTDVTTVNSYNQKAPASIRSRLGGTEGSILDQFHGEYEWDVYDVILHKDRGTDKDIPLRYGKNITDIKQEEEISQTITGIVPYWMDNEGNNLVTLPERAVYSPNASLYPQKLTVPMDFSSDYQEQPTVAQLRAHAQAYVNQSGIGIPKVSIDVSFVNLADTDEYKDLLELQAVDLCDTIPVQFEPLGIDTTAKIVKTEYDVLAEKYKKITVGSLRSNLASTINEQNNSIVTETSAKFQKVGSEIDNATAWLTSSGGYVVAVKNNDGSWKELLFLDDNDIDDAVNVLRINENGIGFSSNGVDGPYTQAWTLDGRLVIGGTNVPSITVYDDQDNIIFQAAATGIVWNATNSSMSADGTLDLKNGVIQERINYGQGQQVLTIDYHGINFSYIENNQVISSHSLTLADIHGVTGVGLSSSTSIALHSINDMDIGTDRYLELDADSGLIIDTPTLIMRRPNQTDAIGYTGFFTFYDGSMTLKKMYFYNGILYDYE